MAGYLVAGALAVLAPGFEVFPFFCWFLFPITPNTVQHYALELQTVGGQPVSAGTTFQTLHLVQDPQAMDVWVSTQALGKAQEAGDAATVDRIRRRLEANFLPAPSRYRLVKKTFDPLERWETGKEQTEVIADYAAPTGCQRSPWAFGPDVP